MSQLTISTQEKRFPVAPDLYGLFFEDISHAGDGGLYPEMLRNRSFEDSLLPDGCITNDNGKTFTSPTGWIDEFNNGEGMNDWIASQKIAPTTIPAWYSENANMQLNKDNTIIGAFLFKLILRKMAKSITSDIMALIKKKEIHIISICLQNQNKHCI